MTSTTVLFPRVRDFLWYRYVGNLTSKINEALLWEVFNAVGGVDTLKIVRDKTVRLDLLAEPKQFPLPSFVLLRRASRWASDSLISGLTKMLYAP